MSAYPWGFTGRRRTRATTSPDHGAFTRRRAAVHRRRRARRARPSTTTPRSSRPTSTPASGDAAATGGAFRGPQPGTVCQRRRPVGAERLRRRPVRQRHRRRAALPRHRARARRDGRCGSRSPAPTRASAPRARELAEALRDPTGAARGEDGRARARSRAQSQVVAARRPRCCSSAIDWGKQNLADLTQTAPEPADPLDEPGQAVPGAAGHRPAARRFFGAGFPDYPWLFATDGEYTAFAARRARPVRDRRGPPARAARRLRRPQRPLGHRRARDRHRRLGLLRPRLADDAADGTRRTTSTPTRRSSSRAPSRSIWRWTGDDRFRDEHVRLRQAQPALRRPTASTPTTTAGPRARATSSAPGMGAGEARQRRLLHPRRSTTSPTWRGPSTTARTVDVGHEPRRASSQRAVRGAPGGTRRRRSTPTRCSTPATTQVFQKHWIGAGADGGRADRAATRRRPASPPTTTARPRSPARENACYSGDRPGNRGLFHTGCGGGADGKGELRDLLADHRRSRRSARATTAAWAPTSSSATPTPTRRRCSPSRPPAARPTSSPARCRRSSRRADGDPTRASAEHRPLLDLPLDGHAGVGQLRHRLAGRSTSSSACARTWATARLEVVPQVPAGPAAASRARTSASATARWTCRPRARAATYTHHGATRRTRPAACSHRPHAAARVAAESPSRSTATRSSTTTATLTNRGLEVTRGARARASSTR